MKAKFNLGQVVSTPGAIECLTRSNQLPHEFLIRHQTGDWGIVCNDDKKANDMAVEFEGDPDKQGRVLSAYQTSSGDKIWIITEWDRSYTTILLPGEY